MLVLVSVCSHQHDASHLGSVRKATHVLVCVLVIVVGVGVGACKLNDGCELLLMCCRETLEPRMHELE